MKALVIRSKQEKDDYLLQLASCEAVDVDICFDAVDDVDSTQYDLVYLSDQTVLSKITKYLHPDSRVVLPVSDTAKVALMMAGYGDFHDNGEVVSARLIDGAGEPVDNVISEESLIRGEDLVTPSAGCGPSSNINNPEMKKKRACKNCSCGLAEELASASASADGTKIIETSDNVKSSCGNCGLGDAFRCGGCPYRGLPAFKPGEKIVLSDDFLQDV